MASKYDPQKWDKEHKKRVEEYEIRITDIFYVYALIMAQEGIKLSFDFSKPFFFKDFPVFDKKVNALLEQFAKEVTSSLKDATSREWEFANRKNDAMVQSLIKQPSARYMRTNGDMLRDFMSRKTYGLTLSDRVWNLTEEYKLRIQQTLDLGMPQGKGAREIARDLKKYLRNPDKLEKSIRNKYGTENPYAQANKRLSGPGVYRSPLQNAMRLARTETNAAYRRADYERWQQMDFVVGVRIRTSKTHQRWLAEYWYPRFKKGVAPLEICDRMEGDYPKDFFWTGWHPNCKCIWEPIISNEGIKDKAFYDTPENKVTEPPKAFSAWVKENKSRIDKARYKPLFIGRNIKYARR